MYLLYELIYMDIYFVLHCVRDLTCWRKTARRTPTRAHYIPRSTLQLAIRRRMSLKFRVSRRTGVGVHAVPVKRYICPGQLDSDWPGVTAILALVILHSERKEIRRRVAEFLYLDAQPTVRRDQPPDQVTPERTSVDTATLSFVAVSTFAGASTSSSFVGVLDGVVPIDSSTRCRASIRYRLTTDWLDGLLLPARSLRCSFD